MWTSASGRVQPYWIESLKKMEPCTEVWRPTAFIFKNILLWLFSAGNYFPPIIVEAAGGVKKMGEEIRRTREREKTLMSSYCCVVDKAHLPVTCHTSPFLPVYCTAVLQYTATPLSPSTYLYLPQTSSPQSFLAYPLTLLLLSLTHSPCPSNSLSHLFLLFNFVNFFYLTGQKYTM